MARTPRLPDLDKPATVRAVNQHLEARGLPYRLEWVRHGLGSYHYFHGGDALEFHGGSSIALTRTKAQSVRQWLLDLDDLRRDDAAWNDREAPPTVLSIEPVASGAATAGRPKRTQPEGPDDEARNHTISAYDSEWRDITAAAEAEGDTPGGWMRDLAVAVARGKVRIVREDG